MLQMDVQIFWGNKNTKKCVKLKKYKISAGGDGVVGRWVSKGAFKFAN